ncbi:MAG: N-acetylmuramoyl-L-alanine amidase, partial [Pseudomonadota bacterium]
MRIVLRPLLLALLLAACAPVPQRAGIPTEWLASPNFSDRKPNFVIIHHTSDDTVDQAVRTLADPVREVSAHYLIARDGRIIQLVDERARAWHAGESKWGSNTDINSASLGIELDNNGREPFADVQVSALLRLLADIKERHRIPSANFLGHADVAPQRKTDPSRYFPWRRLAGEGFGLWCDPPLPEPPAGFDVKAALRALGYDIGNLDAAIRAFRLHFLPDE